MTRAVQSAAAPSPEMSWLCACAAAAGRPIPAVRLLPPPNLDWARVMALAIHHRLIAHVYQALKRVDPAESGRIPVEYRDYFRRQFMSVAACNHRAAEVLVRLQERLAQAGIRLIPVKGPALAALAYGRTSARTFEDLDVIVCGRDLLLAVERLEAEGWEVTEPRRGIDRSRYLALRQEWILKKTGFPLHIDLKPVLISPLFSGPRSADFMAEASRSLDIGAGRRLQAPGPEAMLLAVCLDGANDMWTKLASVADTGALLASHPAADWDGLLAAAKAMGARRAVLTGACLARRLLNTPLPDGIRCAAERDRSAQRLARQAADRLLTETSRQTGAVRQIRFALATRDRFRDRWRALGRFLFVPGPADLAGCSRSPWLIPFQGAARPFRLGWTALRGQRRGTREPRRARAR